MVSAHFSVHNTPTRSPYAKCRFVYCCQKPVVKVITNQNMQVIISLIFARTGLVKTIVV